MGRAPEPDRAAEDNLRNWRAVGRDDAVREAAAAGLSVARIQKLTGLATTTIMRILNQPPKPQACRQTRAAGAAGSSRTGGSGDEPCSAAPGARACPSGTAAMRLVGLLFSRHRPTFQSASVELWLGYG
jgi:hypothetical protein